MQATTVQATAINSDNPNADSGMVAISLGGTVVHQQTIGESNHAGLFAAVDDLPQVISLLEKTLQSCKLHLARFNDRV